MKFMRMFTGDDGETHFEELPVEWLERDGLATAPVAASELMFAYYGPGVRSDFHPAPHKQYVLYLTARVELGSGDGTTVIMDPGDVLQAEDTTGRGHTSRTVEEGLCAFVPLTD